MSTISRLVAELSKLTHLDISRNAYSSMPRACSWPSTLRYLNISGAKLETITPCLATTLEVLKVDHVAIVLTDLKPSQQINSFINHFSLLLYPVQVLDLSNNDLKSFSLFLPALRELYLSGNKIQSLPSGWLLPNLQILTIQVRTNLFFFLLPMLFIYPTVTPPCSSTVKHLEHVWPLRPPVIRTTPELTGGSEQIRLLL